MNTSANTHSSVEDTTVSIIVDGKVTRFDYGDLKKFHKGDSWFGCTVGFRAMQMAAREFSKPELSEQALWSRDNLSIVSGHPGPGVKDAIEMVTATISSNHFQLHESVNTDGCNSGCNSSMRFEWWVTADNKTIHIKLHDGIVPESFLQLLDRLNTEKDRSDNEKEKDRKQFDQMKNDLSNILWNQSLDASFAINQATPSTNSEVKKLC
jgi:hypothetical protein